MVHRDTDARFFQLVSAAALIQPPEAEPRQNETLPSLCLCNIHTDGEADVWRMIPALKVQCEWGYKLTTSFQFHRVPLNKCLF